MIEKLNPDEANLASISSKLNEVIHFLNNKYPEPRNATDTSDIYELGIYKGEKNHEGNQ